MSAAYFNQYLVNQVSAASPEELMTMLYNGAIRFLSEAECAMTEGRIARRGELISKSIAIINELDVTLNYEIGGQIAVNLDALYVHMNRELLLANLKDDPTRLAQVKQLLIGLRDTWMQAIEKIHAGQASGNRPVLETAEGLQASTAGL
ncbi:MAG: flagellar export chaperone FliS [Desulfobulbaceae bacterium]|nr:flagellar export chaperone FliS [Desulfobulbaceae bacterium]